MYRGSVRFYRHLIVGFVVFIILLMTILSIVFGVRSARLSKAYQESLIRIEEIQAELEELKQEKAGEVVVNPVDERTQTGQEAEGRNSESEEQELPEEAEDIPDGPAYQRLYPEMISAAPSEVIMPDQGTVYLTFDDGPSSVTPQILETLRTYDIKATFFIVGKQLTESGIATLEQIVAEGHTVGIHSQTHDYEQIYSSVEAFLDDFWMVYDQVLAATGYRAEIYRFPGGSVNEYNKEICTEIIAEMNRRGFVYYDWNSSAEDAKGRTTPAAIMGNAVSGVQGKNYAIILMHDTVAETGAALDGIISSLLSQGYTFDSLDKSIKPIAFTN